MVVMDALSGGRPAPVLGHSKGGSLMIQLADAQPYRFTHVVNLDGIPYRRRQPDVAEHERARMVGSEVRGWLDHRRRTASGQRKPGTFEELAQRRARMNPRLSLEWLRHLVSVGAFESADGWRWKIDASMRMGGFGPWRPEWTIIKLPGLPMPFLGVLGGEMEEMGWGTVPEEVFPCLPVGGQCEILDDAGHFVHIEQPDVVAAMVLDFVGAPVVSAPVTDAARTTRCSWRCTTCASGTGRPLLLLHGLGEHTAVDVPPWAAAWDGPIAGLDFTGHGQSTIPPGGGYNAEILLADADIALAALAGEDGKITVAGRGLGAYIALMLAGARAPQVHGAVLMDGVGLAGGATGPTSGSFVAPAAERPPHRTRTPCSRCPATCARRTTPPTSCASRSSRPASTSRSRCAGSPARRGSPRWSTRSA